MGIYRKPDSRFWWMYIARPGQKPIRTSTGVPRDGGSPWQDRELRRQAQELYALAQAGASRTHLVDKMAAAPSAPESIPTTRSPDGWCYVYFVRADGCVKIGHARDIGKRMAAMKPLNAHPLHFLLAVPAHRDLEIAIHRRFAHLRREGEWFTLTPELEGFIEHLRTGINPLTLLW